MNEKATRTLIEHPCPVCVITTQMSHDAFEDMYRCMTCRQFFYPEEVGRKTNESAGIFHIGEAP